MEGLIFGGAYLRREICVSKPIGLALFLEVNLPFFLCFTLYLEGRFNGFFFLRYRFGGLIFGLAYTLWGLFSEFCGMLKMNTGRVGDGEGKQTIEKETLLHALSTTIYDLTKLRLLRKTD